MSYRHLITALKSKSPTPTSATKPSTRDEEDGDKKKSTHSKHKPSDYTRSKK